MQHNAGLVILSQVFTQFSEIIPALSIHLVEASPALSKLQMSQLSGETV